MVNDLGERFLAPRQSEQFIQLLQAENRGLLNQDVLAGFKGSFRNLEVAGVGRRNTDNIHAVLHEPVDRIATGVAGEVRHPAGCLALVTLRSRTRATGHCGEGDFDKAKIATVKSLRVKLLEERTVRLLEDHAQA